MAVSLHIWMIAGAAALPPDYITITSPERTTMTAGPCPQKKVSAKRKPTQRSGKTLIIKSIHPEQRRQLTMGF